MKTPVLMLVFSRPEETRRVLEAVRRAAPEKLYVACDGPRTGRPGEAAKVEEVRSLFSSPGWPVTVIPLFRKENLGCKAAVSSAISWFFDQEEEGIILEDDCLPHQDFFPYCEELLEKYRHEPSVMHISGVNFQQGKKWGEASYYFSKYIHVWGWASWRRAWKLYDGEMKTWPEYRQSGRMKTVHGRSSPARYWTKVFDEVAAGGVNTWDYQWVYTIWSREGLGIVPQTNLVENIGFGEGATHTTEASDAPKEMKVQPLEWPLVHSTGLVVQTGADRITERSQFIFPLFKRIVTKIKVLRKRYGRRG